MPSHATTLIFLRQCVVVLRTALTLLGTVHYLRRGGGDRLVWGWTKVLKIVLGGGSTEL